MPDSQLHVNIVKDFFQLQEQTLLEPVLRGTTVLTSDLARGQIMETRTQRLAHELASLDPKQISEAIRIQTEIVHLASKNHSTAGVRGDALHKLAYLFLQNGQLLPARDAIAQSIVFRRMFYGRLSPQAKESMELAQQIRMRINMQVPSLVMKNLNRKKVISF